MANTNYPMMEADEVLILDTSTFIQEIGLMSRQGSALKHYIYRRGTKLVVPQVVVEEYKRHLIQRANKKIEVIENCMGWLVQYFGKMSGWSPPGEDAIEERAKVLAAGQNIEAVLIAETDSAKQRAQARDKSERPPSHRRSSPADCRIWEQCLDLLVEHDVIFVSADKDFRGHRTPDRLHPQLIAEVDQIGAERRLVFHANMESLLSELKSEIGPLPDEAIFGFVYREISEIVQELQSNSNTRPTMSGTVKQTRFTTDAPHAIEVRLEVRDYWESADGAASLPFKLVGSCQYNLRDDKLSDLKPNVVGLTTTEPDGSLRSVKGSRVSLGATAYIGAPRMEAEPGMLP